MTWQWCCGDNIPKEPVRWPNNEIFRLYEEINRIENMFGLPSKLIKPRRRNQGRALTPPVRTFYGICPHGLPYRQAFACPYKMGGKQNRLRHSDPCRSSIWFQKHCRNCNGLWWYRILDEYPLSWKLTPLKHRLEKTVNITEKTRSSQDKNHFSIGYANPARLFWRKDRAYGSKQ